MKIALLVESEKTVSEATEEVQEILTGAGYKVTVTWPDLEPAIRRLENLRKEIKKLQ